MLDRMDKQCLTVVIMEPVTKARGEKIRRRQGAKIRETRKLRNLSQTALAEACDVSKAAVSGWERGEASPIPVHQVRIAQALGVPWFVLFNLDGEAA